MIRIGYPCVNRSVGCSSSKTFRIKNFSKENLLKTSQENLKCLLKVIDFNYKNGIHFFRISSDIIPFASHSINKINWQSYLKDFLKEVARKLKETKIRVSMHPDQFVVLNSPNEDIVKRSIKELIYHLRLLQSFETDLTAKIQIHLGGKYDDKKESIKRFIKNFNKLPKELKERLVIENDEKIYTVSDCIYVAEKIKVPVVTDYLHHNINSNNEDFFKKINEVVQTWNKKDGVPIIDYSCQKENSKKGIHSESIDENNFKDFIGRLLKIKMDFDIMLEIKDKEKSAIKALNILESFYIKK
ncbi:MAG: UV DNA damage repair endonuclease UvsE [Elusimicrobiales bacterium]|nr:UV DNA damage repair endonuclease UvsE [Elusimicrobiales bacterium]